MVAHKPGSTALHSPETSAEDPADVVERVVSIGIVLAAAAAAFVVVSQFVYVFAFDAEVGALNADAENNTFSWLSSSVTFVGAFVALLLSVVDTRRRNAFLLLAAVLAFFSLDDTLQLHEDAGTRVADALSLDSGLVHGVWPVIFFPLLAFAFILIWRVSGQLADRTQRTLRVGLALLVVGVLAEGAASAWYGSGEDAENFVGALEIGVEEGAELAGWILVVTGLTARLFLSLRSPRSAA